MEEETVKLLGWGRIELTEIAKVLAVLLPQELLAVTLKVPAVAELEKLMVTLSVEPVIVAPVPE